jgi:2-dehydro-3-deoxygluconokinase
MLSEARGLRVVDPNLRKGLWGAARRAELILPLIERSDLLFGGEQELAEIVGAAAGLEALARRCAERGPREVVVRCADSVGVLEPAGAFHVFDARRQKALDPIGAGDAFNAGYLAVRLRNGSVEAAFRAGAYCGQCVALDVGDTRGFPRSLPATT